MARGKVENLRKFSEMSVEERDSIQAKGRAAYKAKREQEQQMQETLVALLSLPSSVVFGKDVVDSKGRPASAMYAGCLSTLKRWEETGDIVALEKIMNAIGQKPADKVESKVQAQIVYGWED